MKKILSIILACAMIMSLFCVVPASAAVTSGAYLFEDFEEDSNLITATRTRAEGTVYEGSYSAQKITVPINAHETSHGYDTTHDIACSENYAKTILPGDRIKVTFKYKLTHALAEGSEFAVVANGKLPDGGWTFPSAECIVSDASNTKDWQTFEATLVYPENVVNRAGEGEAPYYTDVLYIRMSDGSNQPLKVATPPEEDIKVGIYLDNVEIRKVVYQGGTTVEKYDGTRRDLKTGGNNYGTIKYEVADPFDPGSNNKVYKFIMSPAGDNYNLGYFFMDFLPVAMETGDTATLKFKLAIDAANIDTAQANYSSFKFSYLETPTSDPTQYGTTPPGLVIGSGKDFQPYHNGVEGWQDFSYSFTYTGTGVTLESARICIGNGAKTEPIYKDSNIYIDDVEITLTPANAPLSKTPVVEGLTAEAKNGVVTLGADYFKNGVGDTEGRNTSVYKLLDANGGVVGSGLVSEEIIIPEDVEATQLQIVPVTSTGYIGEAVTCDITVAEPEEDPIKGTYFEILLDDVITLSSETAIENAKVIFVTYDDDGKMVDFDILSDVDVAANGTIPVAPSKVLNAGTKSVVMLWQDMVNCKPLADALVY